MVLALTDKCTSYIIFLEPHHIVVIAHQIFAPRLRLRHCPSHRYSSRTNVSATALSLVPATCIAPLLSRPTMSQPAAAPPAAAESPLTSISPSTDAANAATAATAAAHAGAKSTGAYSAAFSTDADPATVAAAAAATAKAAIAVVADYSDANSSGAKASAATAAAAAAAPATSAALSPALGTEGSPALVPAAAPAAAPPAADITAGSDTADATASASASAASAENETETASPAALLHCHFLFPYYERLRHEADFPLETATVGDLVARLHADWPFAAAEPPVALDGRGPGCLQVLLLGARLVDPSVPDGMQTLLKDLPPVSRAVAMGAPRIVMHVVLREEPVETAGHSRNACECVVA